MKFKDFNEQKSINSEINNTTSIKKNKGPTKTGHQEEKQVSGATMAHGLSLRNTSQTIHLGRLMLFHQKAIACQNSLL